VHNIYATNVKQRVQLEVEVWMRVILKLVLKISGYLLRIQPSDVFLKHSNEPTYPTNFGNLVKNCLRNGSTPGILFSLLR
jgi:hypothetical protein